MMYYGINTGSSVGFPIFFNVVGGDVDSLKLSEDRYDVYVEDNYIGEKSLLAQNEDFHVIGDFLERQGFENVQVDLNGDHIVVHASNNEEAANMIKALKVYLSNR
ncbi:hypothetical protein [Anaerobacillus alkalilacustris]|nr:hypothetical protein [Anaerobacillus alkalilacustris]